MADDGHALRIDRTALRIDPLRAASDEGAYWRTKSHAERLEAIELSRQIVYGYDPDTERLQRLLEVAQRAPR